MSISTTFLKSEETSYKTEETWVPLICSRRYCSLKVRVKNLMQNILTTSPSSKELVQKIDKMKRLSLDGKLKLIKTVSKEINGYFLSDQVEGPKPSIIQMGRFLNTLKETEQHFQKENRLKNLGKVTEAIEQNCPELLRKILMSISKDEQKELVNAFSKELPLLFLCVHSKSAECLEVLLEAGAVPNQTCPKTGFNFLHFSAKFYDSSIVQAFLDNVDFRVSETLINDKDLSGRTALQLAAFYKNQSLQSVLTSFQLKIENLHKLNLIQHVFGVELRMGGKPIVLGDRMHRMHKEIYRDLYNEVVRAKCFSSYTQEQYAELQRAFEYPTLSELQPEELSKRIQSNKLTVLKCGWDQHAVDLVFRDGYLVICNRGQGSSIKGTFYALKIDPSKVTNWLIIEMYSKKNQSYEAGYAFFYEQLPAILNGTEDEYCRAIKAISPKRSKVGVCGYASAKAALRASLALLSGSPLRALLDSKKWATDHRERVLKDFEKQTLFLTTSSKAMIIEVAQKKLRRHRRFVSLHPYLFSTESSKNY